MTRAALAAVVALVALQLAVATAAATDSPAFRTPKHAVYCSTVSERYWTLGCWTPNDGFFVRMGQRTKVTKGYSADLRHYTPKRNFFGRAWPLLGFGERWSDGPWSCTSRTTGLTCRNGKAHGWWLGRFAGYRVF